METFSSNTPSGDVHRNNHRHVTTLIRSNSRKLVNGKKMYSHKWQITSYVRSVLTF